MELVSLNDEPISALPSLPPLSPVEQPDVMPLPHSYCSCFLTCCWLCRLAGLYNRRAKGSHVEHPEKRKSTRRGAMRRAINKVITSIVKLPPLFWWLIAIYMLASFVYFSTILQLTTLVGIDLDYGTEVATRVYSVYGIISGVCTFVMGILVDRFGAGVIVIVSSVFMLMGRVILTMCGLVLPSWTVWIGIAVCAAIGDGAIFVACRATVTYMFMKHPHQRKIAFALLYASQNVGAMIAGVGIDASMRILRNFPGWPMPISHSIMGIATLASVATLICTIVLVVKLKHQKKQHHHYRHATPANASSRLSSASESASDSTSGSGNDEDGASDEERHRPKSCATVFSIFKEAAIYRFLVLNLFCVGVRSIFRYMDTIFPLVLRRVFGPDVPVGSLYAIDPLFIIFLAPLIQALIAEFSPMRWIVVGMWISALSPMLLAFATPEKLGLVGVILFGIVFAIGEAFWSPRLDDYASEVAKPSQIGVFMASIVPFGFVAKLMVGFVSNSLLTQYCPTDAAHSHIACDTSAIWGLIAGITAVISPLMLTLFYDVVYDPTVRRHWSFRYAQRAVLNLGPRRIYDSYSSSASS